jgi:hypothetical protein
MGKWSYLKKELPKLPDDPTYEEAIAAKMDAMRLDPKTKKPRTLAQLADLYQATQVEEARIKELETANNLNVLVLERIITGKMEDQGTDQIRTTDGQRFSEKIEPYAQVKDRAALRTWAEEHMPDNLQLLWQTLNATVKAALEKGEPTPPGVEVFYKKSLVRAKAKK